jgi:hypothetical protein
MNLPLVPTNFYFLSLLTDAINPALAAPTVLAAAKVILGQDAISPSLGTTYADLNEATFTGYARGATVLWGAPVNDVNTTPTSISPAYLFRATGSTVTNQVQNIAVCDGAAAPGTEILACAAISPPIQFAVTGDGFSAIASWNLGNTPGNLSISIVV